MLKINYEAKDPTYINIIKAIGVTCRFEKDE